jgi:hypothetical protein
MLFDNDWENKVKRGRCLTTPPEMEVEKMKKLFFW